MKKLYALILSLIAFTSYAQQQAGDLSVQFSGNFTRSSVNYGGFKTKSFYGNVYVKIGKFFTPNIELGLKPNVFLTTNVKPNPDDSNDPKYSLRADFGLGLYGTYSILLPDGKFMPYGGAEISYIPAQNDASIKLGPYVGVKYFLTEKINIDANLNALMTLASESGNAYKYVHYSPTFQFNVGIGVLISRENP